MPRLTSEILLDYLKSQSPNDVRFKHLLAEFQILPAHKNTLRRFLKNLCREGKLTEAHGGRYRLARAIQQPVLSGTLRVHRDGYGFVIPDDPVAGQDVFIPPSQMRDAMPDDLVEARYREDAATGKREGGILRVLERSLKPWVGQLEQRGKSFYVVCRDSSSDHDVLVPSSKLHGAKPGQMVGVTIVQYGSGNRPMEGRVIQVLGPPREEETEIKTILIKNNVSREFPPDVTKEVNKIDDAPAKRDNLRVDLSHLPFLTIDGLTAKDFDDAVYVEKRGHDFHLYVAIADVAHYVRPGTKLDEDAYLRGTSVYLPDFAVPMLPERLSNELCSLTPGVRKRALTCEMRLSSQGELLEAWVYESWFLSHKRGIYEDIQNFYDQDPLDPVRNSVEVESPVLKKNLHDMKVLCELLMKKRQERGSIDFDLPEASVVYDHAGKMTAIIRASRFFTHRMIEEMMILANRAVATLLAEHGIPCLYRVHENPDPWKLEEFKELVHNLNMGVPKKLETPTDFARFLRGIEKHPMEALVHQSLLRTMKWAQYSPKHRGHFGLNLDSYSHFTSPIRRYPDLLVHRQLKTLVRRSRTPKLHLDFKKAGKKKKPSSTPLKGFLSEESLQKMATQCNERERSAMEAEREALLLKKVLFMQDHVGERFYGTVRRIVKMGMHVELTPHFVDGFLHVRNLKDDFYRFDEKHIQFIGRKHKRRFKVGDKIDVAIEDVSIGHREVKLALPESSSAE